MDVFARGDLTDIDALEAVFSKYRIDEVFHFVAFAYVGEFVKGSEKVPITEDMPQHPINPYGVTKLIVEWICKDYHEAYQYTFISVGNMDK